MATEETITINPMTENKDAPIIESDKAVEEKVSAPDTPGPEPQYSNTGIVLVAGCVSHSLVGRKEPPVGWDGVPPTNLWSYHVFEPLRNKKIAKIFCGSNAAHYAAIDIDGNLYLWGRNEHGQLGVGDQKNRYIPVKLTELGPVKSVALGRSHTLVLTQSGDIYAAGQNHMAQCGIGRATPTPLLRFTRTFGLEPGTAVAVACGNEFALALNNRGETFSCGSQQDGQCGSGATGEYIISAGRIGYKEIPAFERIEGLIGVNVTAIAAGVSHGVALTTEGRVYTWGSGGYGRCGHGVPADCLVPKSLKLFEQEGFAAKAIYTGATSTFIVTHQSDTPYMCGITKKTGEANMTPKPMNEIAGVIPRHIGIGSSSVVLAADSHVITWGPSPTSGELGLGDKQKSSTKPQYVLDLEGVHAIYTCMGQGSSYLLIDDESDTLEAEAMREILKEGRLDIHDPVEPPPMAAGIKRPLKEASPSARGRGRGRM